MIFKALQRLLIEFDFPRDDVVQKYRNGETDRGASLGVQSRTSFKVVLRLKEKEGQEMRVLSHKGKAIENVKWKRGLGISAVLGGLFMARWIFDVV